MDGASVHGGAVLRAQIFHEEVLAHQLEAGMTAGHVAGADDDVGPGRAAHDDGPVHGDGDTAQLFGAALHRHRPAALLLAGTFDHADAGAHDGEQKQIEQRHEQQARDEQNEIDHR